MARIARSARGEKVDFDILSIKQALASAPIAVGTDERRVFIDTRNGLKPKPTNSVKVAEVIKPQQVVPNALKDIVSSIQNTGVVETQKVEETQVATVLDDDLTDDKEETI